MARFQHASHAAGPLCSITYCASFGESVIYARLQSLNAKFNISSVNLPNSSNPGLCSAPLSQGLKAVYDFFCQVLNGLHLAQTTYFTDDI